MNVKRFDVLAALVLSGEATEEQRREFEGMMRSSSEHQVAFEKLKRVWHTDLKLDDRSYEQQREGLWRRYQMQQRWRGRVSISLPAVYKVAAVILLLFAAGIIFYVNNTASRSISDLGTQVVRSEVVKETRAGEKLKTRLPDGTGVYLNAGSRLVFPEHFPDSARVVYLVGEGYFDVVEDSKRPFTVRTESMDITALGTAFGVNAYNKNVQDRVALVSGKLLIRNIKNEEIRIDSGQTITMSRGDYSFSKSSLDYVSQVAWKDGVLHFENNTLSEVLYALELNYGVRFTINSELNSIKEVYTGTFKNESLENILKVLSFSMDFNYEMNGKEVLIEKK